TPSLSSPSSSSLFFFFTHTSPTQIYTLSLHDALPIFGYPPTPSQDPRNCRRCTDGSTRGPPRPDVIPPRSVVSTTCGAPSGTRRSEEHTSELQSRFDLVCRLLLEKKNTQQRQHRTEER